MLNIYHKLLAVSLTAFISFNTAAQSNKGEEAGQCFASIKYKAKNKLPITQGMAEFHDKNLPRFENILKVMNGPCKGLSGTSGNEPCFRKNLSNYDFDFYVGVGAGLGFINSPQDPKKLPNIEVASMSCMGIVK